MRALFSLSLLALAVPLGPFGGRLLLAQVERPAGEGRIVTLIAGRSQIVDAPWPVKRVSVTNPEVADVEALAPAKIMILGKSLGSTDVFLWSETDALWQAQIEVVANLEQFRAVLSRTFPGSQLDVSQSRDVVIVSGTLTRAEHSAQLRSLLDVSGFKYVDRTGLAGVQQVQIQVRVAEVSRTAIKALAVNMFHSGEDVFGGSAIGSAAGGALNPVSIGIEEGTSIKPDIPFIFPNDVNVSPFATLFGGLPDHNIEAFVQALAENQYLRLLSEPNLVALSGEEASFLAGGEFPVPIVQGAAAGGNATITIEYKEFGVSLHFRPTVLGDGTIRLHVEPEVSELSDTGAVEIQGFRIPSLVTRRASTTLELKSGQSFAMAGLLSSSKAARSSRIPLLGDLPVLGALFRSVRYQAGETELVVLATASLVEPLSLAKKPLLPGSAEVSLNDWEIFIEGRIEGETSNAAGGDPAMFQAMGLDKLKGPGAWTHHNQKPARARPADPDEKVEPGTVAAVPAESPEGAFGPPQSSETEAK